MATSTHDASDPTACPPAFVDALADAERLLKYAAETGVEVDDTTRASVLQARSISPDAWTEPIIANLLEALTKLAALLKPVTAASLTRLERRHQCHRPLLSPRGHHSGLRHRSRLNRQLRHLGAVQLAAQRHHQRQRTGSQTSRPARRSASSQSNPAPRPPFPPASATAMSSPSCRTMPPPSASSTLALAS